jgi:hypothetical protein
MAELPTTELFPIPTFLSLKDLDFDNLEDTELEMLREEIDVILKIRQLKSERMQFIKSRISDEKILLRAQMQKEIKREKEKILRDYEEQIREEQNEEENSDSIVESVEYTKKTPKGRVIKAKGRPAKKK